MVGIELRNRDGVTVGECRDLHDFVPWMAHELPESLLGLADPYADTSISGPKVPRFLSEWHEMEGSVGSWAQRETWECISNMARRAVRNEDLMLVLLGD